MKKIFSDFNGLYGPGGLVCNSICMLGNFACYFCHLLTFFQINFKKIMNSIRVSNCLDQDKDRHSVRPDLSPNCFKGYQQTTKVADSMKRVKKCLVIIKMESD